MFGLRSLLWIGDGDTLDTELASCAPSLELTWVRDADDAMGLPVDLFDAVLIDAADASAAAVALRRVRGRMLDVPVVVRLPRGEVPVRHALRAVGAADVLMRDEAKGAPLLERLRSVVEGRAASAIAPPAAMRSALSSRAVAASSDVAASVSVLASGATRANGGDRASDTPLLHAGSEPASGRARGRVTGARPSHGIVGRSAAMRAVMALVERAARTVASVLVTGETGTGKELLARAIHDLSPRRSCVFVALNCAAFPETLLESELFGHRRGSFTGAERDKKGLFEEADGGTLFLDEVGETSPALQAKLLRALQEREIRPIGGARARPVDVRVVAATNRRLRDLVAAGEFRADLYYRLAVFPIPVPPLRERGDDVVVLARHFLDVHARREGRAPAPITDEAMALLLAHPWPGNVRELQNEMTRAAALLEPGEPLRPVHLSERLHATLAPVEVTSSDGETLRQTLHRVEALVIRRMLDATSGRRTTAARRLGITREGLYKKMRRLGIE